MKVKIGWLASTILAIALIASVLTSGFTATPLARPIVGTVEAATAALASPAPSQGLSVRGVTEKVKPAVVQITAEQGVVDRQGRTTSRGGTGIGSGVVYDAQGMILTNNHVVENASTLTVTFPDGRVYTAKLLGGDKEMDLAVVKIDTQVSEILPVAVLGDSDALGVGDGLVAIGNALGLPGGPTVTSGVVSALGRAIQEPSDTSGQPGPYLYDLIQTDAAINPGNSGGPLLNMAGEVVGINTLGAGGGSTQGIGFAIAISSARPIADQLARDGKVVHPFVGISYGPLTAAQASKLNLTIRQGILIGQVAPESPAAKAGIKAQDVVTAVDDQKINGETSLGRALIRHKPGDRVVFSIIRDGQPIKVEVTLGTKGG
jgi:serine protease Do